MYITCRNGVYEAADEALSAVVAINNPVYVENGIEKTLTAQTKEGGIYRYADQDNLVEITVEKKSDTLFYIKRIWKNLAETTRKIQTSFRIEPCFEVNKYLIPCVSVNGNEFGNGKEPKGLEKDGQKWIFAYDRVSIPSCTLTENKDITVALFASAEDEKSLVSSCSISRNKETGAFIQEIYHPVIEKPLTYCDRDQYSDAYETFLELQPGETFACGMYLSVSKPHWENFGICHVLDQALEIFGDNSDIQVPTDREIWDRSITFAKSLITDYKGKKGFVIGFFKDGKGKFVHRDDNCFELAWCGQNVMFSRMLIEDYIRFGNEESLSDALEILDTRVKYCTAENGLMLSYLADIENMEEATTDTCNLGYGAYELLRCYKRLKEIHVDRPEYLEAVRKLCDFFCENYMEDYGFGKQWKMTGECLAKTGTIGAFVIPAMAELYRHTGEQKYLDMAEKAMKFYVERDLDQFRCTAGALDTDCVDKETSEPFIISSVLLYELTHKEIYLEYGKKAAYYFTSWMFHYQPVYGETADMTQLGFSVKGLTSVSAQHHHLDAYAGLAVPYLYKLQEYTDDEKLRIRGDMMWRAILQCIGDGKLVIHDMVRPIGSQNEGFLHCRWGEQPFYWSGVKVCDGKRGDLNDWLVAWPCAFRLGVLAEKESF